MRATLIIAAAILPAATQVVPMATVVAQGVETVAEIDQAYNNLNHNQLIHEKNFLCFILTDFLQ
jgi:hypothetical protein